MSSQFHISVHSPAPSEAVAVVDAGLDEYNIDSAPLGDVQSLHAIAKDSNGTVVGGAIGRTWGECCELQQLWVSAEWRTSGIGTRLMEAFEQNAHSRGCRLIYLETFSFQAPNFYQSRGYEQVLRTAGFTGGVIKFTLHKRLDGSGAETALAG
jgi:GNAT superfamily N-acetyltransferase